MAKYTYLPTYLPTYRLTFLPIWHWEIRWQYGVDIFMHMPIVKLDGNMVFEYLCTCLFLVCFRYFSTDFLGHDMYYYKKLSVINSD